ncbi:hypothetical protein IFM89_012066 [Coptis chinensis]|uniref:Pentatricopeptide repeat-containing protein n=1 Tax=Coptis chinensis TaxID=261450 RepID=A0A835I2P4_9MAGN|nr:hypothetical protein IFM89_012066 [Coptis chinensis]
MNGCGVAPNQITFLGVLTACSHGGLVEEGLRLDDAEKFIMQSGFENDAVMWRALLSACRVHGASVTGERVAKRALACRIERDYKIAESIEREGKGCVTIVNKWDTIPNKKLQTASYYEEDVKEKFRSLNWAPIVYSTGMVGHSVEKIVATASSVERERSRRWE